MMNNNENNIEIKEIMDLLPHRFPFLLVDKIIDFEKNVGGTGIKNFTINEEFFQGHFPNNPVVPGVIIIEAIAQTAAILGIKSAESGDVKKGVLFANIDSAKFRKSVVPGDRLYMKVKLLKQKMGILFIEGHAYVDDKLVMECKLSALIHDIKK